MVIILACPDPLDLDRLGRGQLPEAEAERLRQHVLNCSPCATRLNTIHGVDPFIADLQAFRGQGLPADAEADALIERLLRMLPEPTTAAGSATVAPGTPTVQDPFPSRVGRYDVVARLGAGGMGVVFRGHDRQLHRDVAIKVPRFRGDDEARAAARQRFLRETRAAAAVRHANICPIYDVGEQDGLPYVVMALVEGESLNDRLQRQGRFEDLREAVDLAVKVADALAVVHAAHLVHRDLKPGNILLDRAGQPYLADFGLARADDGEHLTSVNQLVGTPAYMAPEQAYPDLGPVSTLSDQYSLGVVIYQMLTGRLPFEGSAMALIFQIGSKTAPPPSQHRPDLDPGLERLLMKALARPPQDRYASVTDFANALRAWRDKSAVSPHPTPKDHPARAGQRRRLTLLRCGCEVVGAEALLETLDPEDRHDLLKQFQQLCRDVAEQYEGIVVRSTHHGLLICFGYPVALECAARRATRAGLHLLERMAALNERLLQRQEVSLVARIAVHGDLTIVQEAGGSGEALTIVGQVLSVVEQLESLAAPDTVVISDDIYHLVKGFFECASLGPQKLKGAASVKPIYRVHRELAVTDRLQVTGAAGLTPLIGRDREVALLKERWEQAVEGMGQVVLLAGEAGIGKSRLVHELKEHIAGQAAPGSRAMVIEWPCTLQTQNSSLFRAIQSFEESIGLEPHDTPSQKLDKFVAHLGTLQLASAEAVALLASMLSIPLDGRYPNLGLSPVRQKEKTLEFLLDWLCEQAHRQPVLFIIEDLHWSSPTNLEFLNLLVGQAQGSRLLTLLTFRPEFAPPWKARANHTQISLNHLTRRQTGELMVAKSKLPTIPQKMLDQVADRTDGVPLFVEEFTTMLLEAGCLCKEDGEGRMADAFEGHTIPATLQDLLMARLDRMGSDLEVVQLAAAIGREFSYELLSAVASCSEESLQKELAKLVDAELLFQHGRLPRARYQFKHALIQDAAYQSLLKKKRQQFHLRIAELLEQRFPEICAAQPELLAHHFTEAHVIAKAVENWARAGERSQQRGSAVEAVGHFNRGLELIRTLPETRERHGQEIRLHISLGVALAATRGFGAPEVETTYERAYALCLQSGLTAQVFPALFGRLRVCMNQAKHACAQELAEELLRLADREANTGFEVAAHCGLGITLFLRGKHPEALQHLQKALAIEPTPELRSGLHRYAPLDPWVTSQTFLAFALWLLGYPERAAESSRQARSTAERLGHPFSLGFALSYASWLHQIGQDRERTHAIAAQALALGTEKGLAGVIEWSRMLCGWTLVEPGQSDQAVIAIRQGLEGLRAQGALSDRNGFLTLLAEACARAGRLEEGLKALAEAQEFADATGEVFWQPEIHRLKGELLLQRDPTAVQDAEASFHQALTVARQQQARSLELRAAMSLGRLWDRQGKRPEARELVAKVYSAFTEGFQTYDLQTARALLEQWQQALAE